MRSAFVLFSYEAFSREEFILLLFLLKQKKEFFCAFYMSTKYTTSKFASVMTILFLIIVKFLPPLFGSQFYVLPGDILDWERVHTAIRGRENRV